MVGIHITGASGSGTTTLGVALSEKIGVSYLDTDDFYWSSGDPPNTQLRPPIERLQLLGQALSKSGSWVLSGSIDKWGVPLVARFDLVIFLSVPTEVRLARLRAREIERYGEASLAPGGNRHEPHKDFLEWAAQYESGTAVGRNRAKQERWLRRLSCPVLRLEGDRPPDVQVADSLAFLHSHKLLID